MSLRLIEAMRPKHWLKNLLIFVPIIFARAWTSFSVSIWMTALFTFIAFCAIASAGYLVNDVWDIREDRLHPTKKSRPIASGTLSPRFALFFAFGLAVGSVFIGFSQSQMIGWVLLVYGAHTLLYSRFFKHVPIVDLVMIAFGFVLRILAGGYVIDALPSGWLVICTFSVALLLGTGKRLAEIRWIKERKTRKSLPFYTINRLKRMERILGSFIILFYFAYTLSGKHSFWMVLSTIPVIYGVVIYSRVILKRPVDGPTELLLQDRHMQLALILWLLISISVLFYFY